MRSVVIAAFLVGWYILAAIGPAAPVNGQFIYRLPSSSSSSLCDDAVDAGTIRYVRAGASGANDGTNWTDAFTAVPGTLTRGWTYCVADGAYADLTVDDADSGTTRITIAKATIADHGTSTGWSDTFGDGQAVFGDQIEIQANYVDIDGQGSRPTNGTFSDGVYGIAARYSGADASLNTFLGRIGTDPSGGGNFVTFKHVEIDCGTMANQRNGLRLYDETTTSWLHNVQVHHCGSDLLQGQDFEASLFEYVYAHTRNTDPTCGDACHSDAFQVFRAPATTSSAPNIWRWSRIEDWDGQQLFWSNFDSGPWEVYGSIFEAEPGVSSASVEGVKFGADGPTSIKICNNTFVNLSEAHTIGSVAVAGVIRNNIYYALTVGVAGFGDLAHDFNWFHTALGTTHSESNPQTGSNPFINYSGEDFRLSGATTAGNATGCPSDNATDMYGVTRGADGVADRGAIEFSGS